MTYYVQETDSRIIFPYLDDARYYISVEPIDETLGGKLDSHFTPLPKESSPIKAAREIIRQIGNRDVAKEAEKLLLLIQETITHFQQSGFDISYLPKLRAFNVDDGSVLLEWIFNDLRMGFVIEPNPLDSGWYLVTNRNLGEISASGYISSMDINILIVWLLNFVLANS